MVIGAPYNVTTELLDHFKVCDRSCILCQCMQLVCACDMRSLCMHIYYGLYTTQVNVVVHGNTSIQPDEVSKN